MYQAALDTPIGRLMIEGTRDAVTAVRWVAPDAPVGKGCKVVIQARKQLREYFKGKRRTFDVPISLDRLTDFQRAVLAEVRAVGYGETITYAEIARRLKKATAPRAVGQANARNPINIIIPCHRVLSSDGKLTGYAGGVQAKAWLLKHEQAVLV
ncbi:MAG: methylated-DNA--[protein]-cysteine S-methyltransferase [Anaerolineae bacterium]|nr:methylated-DNA--[protein]-cysteine S-methyltransferase [Candidatus Roseilinea sp.]MDW8451000.1 methylated-DNA--[protein]-cysteine S-methyltransferase [Anaerolineae bacterium]